MFIEEKDLYTAIREYEVKEIVDGDPTLINIAISRAIGEMKPYLYRYDCDTIFSATGTNRDPVLVGFAVHIAVFELVSIARPDQDLQNRRALYNRAIGWLKQVRDEQMPCNLPLLPVAPEDAKILFHSNLKRKNYY